MKFVETTKYNESPDRIYNMKKKEKFTIIEYEYKNLYISFDIREFNIINDIIYFQFRGNENTFDSNDIYYNFNEKEYTEQDIELEYNISTECKKKYNQKTHEIIYYCNYTRKEKDKLSLKFILFINKGSNISIFNTENNEYNPFEPENDLPIYAKYWWVILLIITIIVILTFIIILIRKQNNNINEDINKVGLIK